MEPISEARNPRTRERVMMKNEDGKQRRQGVVDESKYRNIQLLPKKQDDHVTRNVS